MMWTVWCALSLLVAAPKAATRIRTRAEPTVRARDGPYQALSHAADIELFAACLASGATLAVAAEVVADVSGTARQQWSSVAAMLAIGVDARTAWTPMRDATELAEVARVAKISERSGSALATSCVRIAEDIRQRTSDSATAAAERAGVFIALPLALCFLPAFFILGLAPIVINLTATMIP
ncbi:type II secretion system F family protein [Corynebacterium sp. H128]|uniref:type II secretion system F family protein n=1 Tax=unclassified Corynebacterium TaxID=2624378 RepID=UPI00309DD078